MQFAILLLSLVGLTVAASAGGAGSKSSSTLVSTATSNSEAVDVIAFQNVGYNGFYYNVESFSDILSDSCSCKLSSDTTAFLGTNAPLNEELSVHFRGPLVLQTFAWYTAESYTHGLGSGTFERRAYYNASTQTNDNVTFLTNAGAPSPCLGNALTYASSNGTGAASGSTVLAEGTVLGSNEEYSIFSNISCGSSGTSNDCGVYRSGIPAYHGFFGVTKMFLFEFEMPEETAADEDTTFYNMPAIWLLNAHIPRTSQYATDSNCSCWTSGCGEFDIFEIMNTTELTKLYSTVHDYQGTGDINFGLQAFGHFTRDTTSTMKGGVVFDDAGNVVVFMLDSMDASNSISGSDLDGWINNAGKEVTKSLSSVAPASTTKSKSSNGTLVESHSIFAVFISALFLVFLYI